MALVTFILGSVSVGFGLVLLTVRVVFSTP